MVAVAQEVVNKYYEINCQDADRGCWRICILRAMSSITHFAYCEFLFCDDDCPKYKPFCIGCESYRRIKDESLSGNS